MWCGVRRYSGGGKFSACVFIKPSRGGLGCRRLRCPISEQMFAIFATELLRATSGQFAPHHGASAIAMMLAELEPAGGTPRRR
jgi:hypothetical protein